MPIHPETKLPASVAVLEDGRVLAAVWDDGTAYRWEPESASFFRGEVDPEIWSLWRDSELHDAVDSWSEGAPPANQVRVSIRTRLFRAVHSIDSLETVIRLPSDGLAARLLAEIQRRLPESGTDTGLTSLEIR
jgi:hypothetical protein